MIRYVHAVFIEIEAMTEGQQTPRGIKVVALLDLDPDTV